MRWLAAIAFVFVLAGCGYRFVGEAGNGRPVALPAGEDALALEAEGDLSAFFRLRLNAAGVQVRSDAAVVLRVEGPRFSFAAASFDASGAPLQYRLRATGRLVLEREGEVIWQSGVIAVEDWIAARSDPGVLEAARRDHERLLRQRWLNQAWARFAAGW